MTSAFVWPLQQNTPNDLGGQNGEVLTVAGETFRLMAELLDGSILVARTTFEGGIAHVYATDDGFVVAAALGSDMLSLDLGQWGTIESAIVHEIDATGDRLGPRAVADVESYGLSGDLLTFGDYQTVFAEVRGALDFHGPVVTSTRSLTEGHDHHVTTAATETFILGGAGRDTLQGGATADRFDGGVGLDLILGDDGNDVLAGGRDDDTLDGGTGADVLSGDEGKDELHGGLGSDMMSGGAWDDTPYGGEGNDVMYGDGGRDWLEGQDDDDRVFGGDWHDTLLGEAGNDVLHGDLEDDSLDGGTGDDLIYADEGADTLHGGDGADTLYGSQQANVTTGGAGNDVIFADEAMASYLDYLDW